MGHQTPGGLTERLKKESLDKEYEWGCLFIYLFIYLSFLVFFLLLFCIVILYFCLGNTEAGKQYYPADNFSLLFFCFLFVLTIFFFAAWS